MSGEPGRLRRFVPQVTISATRQFQLSTLSAIPRPVLPSRGKSAIQRSWAHDRAQQNSRNDCAGPRCTEPSPATSVVRASFSSRWHAAAVRPGRPTVAAGRHVRSTSNFGIVSAARTTCETVKMIGNSAGMICPPLAPSSQSHVPSRMSSQATHGDRLVNLIDAGVEAAELAFTLSTAFAQCGHCARLYHFQKIEPGRCAYF